MAQQTINIGTSNNSGNGEGLRPAFDKCNDNFTELYSVSGWGFYSDDETTPATQTISTTPSKIQIDGAGSTSESGYLPYEIRGVSELWDTTNDKITPISIGDSYDLRMDLEITAKTGSPTFLDFQLDIGGAASPTISIVNRTIGLSKTPPYNVSFGFPVFCLSTFLTNGGQLFLSTDTGTVTIGARAIFIKRNFKGNL